MTKTYVIVKQEKNESDLWYFYEWRFGIPVWGREEKEAIKFTSKEDARKHIPGLRLRKTTFGTYYQKGIKIMLL